MPDSRSIDNKLYSARFCVEQREAVAMIFAVSVFTGSCDVSSGEQEIQAVTLWGFSMGGHVQ